MSKQLGDRPARVVGAGKFNYGSNAPADDNMRQGTIPYISGAVSGLEVMQTSRNAPVPYEGLAAAVFYEHRTLIDQSILSTPFLSNLDLCNNDQAKARAEADKLRRTFTNGSVYHHPVYHGAAQREFVILNLCIDGGYAAVVARIVELPQPRYNARYDELYRHIVDTMVVIDPRDSPDRVNRQFRAVYAARQFFRHGSILVDVEDGTRLRGMRYPMCGDNPELTGYWMFGINRELIRRLRVVLNTRRPPLTGLTGQANPDFFWDPIQEDWNVDMLRQAMIGSDALRAVQMSNYNAYIGLVIPGDIATRQMDDLQPPPNMMNLYPDEYFRGFDNEGPALIWTGPAAPGGGGPGGPGGPSPPPDDNDSNDSPPPPYHPGSPNPSYNSASSGSETLVSFSSDSDGSGSVPLGLVPSSRQLGNPFGEPDRMDGVTYYAQGGAAASIAAHFFRVGGTKRARSVVTLDSDDDSDDGDDNQDEDNDYQPGGGRRAPKRRRQSPTAGPSSTAAALIRPRRASPRSVRR